DRSDEGRFDGEPCHSESELSGSSRIRRRGRGSERAALASLVALTGGALPLGARSPLGAVAPLGIVALFGTASPEGTRFPAGNLVAVGARERLSGEAWVPRRGQTDGREARNAGKRNAVDGKRNERFVGFYASSARRYREDPA